MPERCAACAHCIPFLPTMCRSSCLETYAQTHTHTHKHTHTHTHTHAHAHAHAHAHTHTRTRTRIRIRTRTHTHIHTYTHTRTHAHTHTHTHTHTHAHTHTHIHTHAHTSLKADDASQLLRHAITSLLPPLSFNSLSLTHACNQTHPTAGGPARTGIADWGA